MEQLEKVRKGLQTAVDSDWMWQKADYIAMCCKDALALIRQQQERIKAQDEVIQALRKVGYPHNFQREPTWVVNYMYAITDVIKKAVKLE